MGVNDRYFLIIFAKKTSLTLNTIKFKEETTIPLRIVGFGFWFFEGSEGWS